ncbi:TIM-barrel domain-containing protein [Shewanella sp.]|uniref:TIM-barrel domain-containing protein n=1 Tax=Shewanella sp. TaxID=50422 RepID=UPI0040489869
MIKIDKMPIKRISTLFSMMVVLCISISCSGGDEKSATSNNGVNKVELPRCDSINCGDVGENGAINNNSKNAIKFAQSHSLLWIWEDKWNTQEAINGLIDKFVKFDIAVGAVIVDSPWGTQYNNFDVDKARYPNIFSLFKKLKEKNIKVIAWITPYVNSIPHETAHSQFDEYLRFSIDKGRIFQWWKGSGYLIDFRKNGSSNKFFSQSDSMLNNFDGYKVDQVAQDSYLFENGLYEIVSKAWLKAVRNYFPEKLIMARGFSHQGGLQGDSDDLDVNWGGDFTGDINGMEMQYSNLCEAMTKGYKKAMYEIGGYNPPFASLEELRSGIVISTGFPFANIGGKGMGNYISLIEENSDLVVKLKYRQSLHHLLGIEGLNLQCKDNVIQNEYMYIIGKDQNIPKVIPNLFNYDLGTWHSAGEKVEPGLYFFPGIYCFNVEDPQFAVASKMLDLNRNKVCLRILPFPEEVHRTNQIIEELFQFKREQYDLIDLSAK